MFLTSRYSSQVPISLSNIEDIVANSFIFKGTKEVDVIERIDAVKGLAPETLHSLERLKSANHRF